MSRTFKDKIGQIFVVIGEDDDGYEVVRPATVDEAHAAWISERNGFDASAQAADDRATEGFR